MYKLIASDLDGTITDSCENITKANLKASEYLRKNAIPLVICTGKTYPLSSNFCKKLHAKFGIFGNGSQILDLNTEKELKKSTLSLSDIEACFYIAQKYNFHIHAYTKDSIITPKLLYMDLRNSILFSNKLKFEIVPSFLEYIKLTSPSVFKLVISSPSSLNHLKNELEKNSSLNINHIFKTGKYKDYVINKEYEYLDIVPYNVSKGTALDFLLKYLSLEKKDILSIGDNLNDIEMFNSSCFSVAVNNAHDLVKSRADYITKASAENSGFAEAIYKFISF